MHFQHRNPSHDRSHRISLMPLATNAQGSSYVRQIIGIADEAKAEGLPPIWKGVGACILAIAAGFAVITGLSSLRDPAPTGLAPHGLQSTIAGEQ